MKNDWIGKKVQHSLLGVPMIVIGAKEEWGSVWDIECRWYANGEFHTGTFKDFELCETKEKVK